MNCNLSVTTSKSTSRIKELNIDEQHPHGRRQTVKLKDIQYPKTRMFCSSRGSQLELRDG